MALAAHAFFPAETGGEMLVPLLGLPCRGAVIARGTLLPGIAEDLDAKALVVGIVAGEVAIGLETDDGVVAGEEELLKVAHLEQGSGEMTLRLYRYSGVNVDLEACELEALKTFKSYVSQYVNLDGSQVNKYQGRE